MATGELAIDCPEHRRLAETPVTSHGQRAQSRTAGATYPAVPVSVTPQAKGLKRQRIRFESLIAQTMAMSYAFGDWSLRGSLRALTFIKWVNDRAAAISPTSDDTARRGEKFT